jgi:ATP-binding cassette, subfamily B (MDR/TAP), member 1
MFSPYSKKLILILKAFAGVGFGIIYSFTLNYKLALLMCAFIPITFISGVISGSASTNTKSNGRYSIEEGGRLATETVENIKTIISLGRENHFIKEFNSVFNKAMKKVYLMIHVSGFFYSLSNSIIFFIQSAAFGYGWILIRDEGLEITSLYQIYACLTFSSMILGRVYSQLPDQKKAKDGARTAFRIIERKSKIDSFSEEGLMPDSVLGEIKFENVQFHYPNRPDIKILKGFNLICKKGQTNALVGPSGRFLFCFILVF